MHAAIKIISYIAGIENESLSRISDFYCLDYSFFTKWNVNFIVAKYYQYIINL